MWNPYSVQRISCVSWCWLYIIIGKMTYDNTNVLLKLTVQQQTLSFYQQPGLNKTCSPSKLNSSWKCNINFFHLSSQMSSNQEKRWTYGDHFIKQHIMKYSIALFILGWSKHLKISATSNKISNDSITHVYSTKDYSSFRKICGYLGCQCIRNCDLRISSCVTIEVHKKYYKDNFKYNWSQNLSWKWVKMTFHATLKALTSGKSSCLSC